MVITTAALASCLVLNHANRLQAWETDGLWQSHGSNCPINLHCKDRQWAPKAQNVRPKITDSCFEGNSFLTLCRQARYQDMLVPQSDIVMWNGAKGKMRFSKLGGPQIELCRHE